MLFSLQMSRNIFWIIKVQQSLVVSVVAVWLTLNETEIYDRHPEKRNTKIRKHAKNVIIIMKNIITEYVLLVEVVEVGIIIIINVVVVVIIK